MNGLARRWVPIALAVSVLAACAVPEATAVPFGYPITPCPVSGEAAVEARAGYELVPPGSIAFNYATWQNESPETLACGAQSVQGATTTIHVADVVGDLGIPFVATLQRAVPLRAPDPNRPQMLLFRLDAAGPALIDTQQVPSDPGFQATGWALPDVPVGRYRMRIVSAVGEVLAEGSFEIVD